MHGDPRVRVGSDASADVPERRRAVRRRAHDHRDRGQIDAPSAQTLPPTFRSDAAQSGGTQPEPTTVEVVQPERTIVRDVDEVLPIVLSGTALLAVLALFGFTLVRTRIVPRPGRSH